MSDESDATLRGLELSEREMADLCEALVNAYAPAKLDEATNEDLIRQALEEPLAPATEEELVESERLRRALESGEAHPDLDLMRALASAHKSKLGMDAKADQAVERATRSALASPTAKYHGTVVYLTFAAVLAAAAAVVLFVQAPRETTASKSEAAPAQASQASEPWELSRSSEPLFEHSFQLGHTSQRIDRIASARTRDLRANRFREWGVK